MTKSERQKSNSRVCPKCRGKGTVGISQYRRGRDFEYKVRNFLQERGWQVYRSYGSKGVIDLLAIKGELKLGIQAKNRKTGGYLTPKEQSELKTFYDIFKNNINDSYTMNIWKNHKIVPLTVKGPIATVHAYSQPGKKNTYWRILGNDGWRDASKLIKTGKL